jgi:nitroimidazol reductase NimA-like FMN-containing flavoprotein (pyridoxamine 5'-phosphate oxidase superfamily)
LARRAVAINIESVEADDAGVQVLTPEEAVSLLGSAQVGHIGVSSKALPLVLPVPYVVDGDNIVIRTHVGSALSDATHDSVVAFEVDGPPTSSVPTWSVHVNGVAVHVPDGSIDAAASRALPSWSSDRAPHLVSISIDLISGRRLILSR